jgi:S-DNA-T family DNA segregation ATPase FtsK/SpoIIIE
MPQYQQAQKPTASAPGSESFNRPPRIWKAPPQESMTLPMPPTMEAPQPMPAVITLILPLILAAMMFGIYSFAYRGNPQELIFLVPIVLYSVMTPISSVVTARQKAHASKKQWKAAESSYRQSLGEIRAHIVTQSNLQRQIALETDPDPAELETRIVGRSHLWERRPDDPDFLMVRVGKGKRPCAVTLTMPEIVATNPLKQEAQQLARDLTEVGDMPCVVPLTQVKSLGITGRRQDVAGLIRGMLCQIATHHSPEDVRIFGIYPVSQQRDWEWMAELPHTLPLKAGQQERLVAVGEEEANALLNVLLEELSQRASRNEGEGGPGSGPASASEQESPLPHLVVLVHDYVEVRKHPALTHAFKLGRQLGVSVIYMVAQQQAIPSECRGVVRLSDEGLISYAEIGYAGETFDGVDADIMELEMAQRIAHALLPLHVAQEDDEASDLPLNVRLLDLLGLQGADQFDAQTWWGDGSVPRYGRLRVPIGVGLNGTVWLDLNENVHGPHGIIAGTTGAGKSELLQSIIVGLALTHHPHLVNFVLVDFKGGAAFKPFEKIPHTVGMVTDLSGALTERALAALKSELRRREHILSQANVRKISEYQALRLQRREADLEPLPDLFIIIDEFAELAKEHPTFMDGLVSVVQKGRSLGVHLILATQKPTGSVNPTIWSNLKFRICLRVASLTDSRDMLGRSEAALLPSGTPGRAYFQIGSEIFELFQSARISMPALLANQAQVATGQEIDEGELTDQKVLMDAIKPYAAVFAAQLFKPWPAPLPHKIGLAEIFRRASPSTSGAVIPGQPLFGWLTAPVGMLDLPSEQKQDPWLLDLPHQGGHAMIAGSSTTGKSIFLRTLVTALIQTHSPTQLHLYMIDFGGQALRVFEKLPHVGGIFGEADDEYIRRLLRKLDGIIEERKQLYATLQIDDFLTYQRRRAEQASLPPMPAVVLIIDKFGEFRQVHDKEMELFLSIARYGRTYGVYIVIAVDRPAAFSMQLLTLFEIRIGLRLVEQTDSLLFLGRNDACRLDPATPGRGYIRGKTLEEVQIALPVDSKDDDEQTLLLDQQVQRIAYASQQVGLAGAPPIQLLPEYVRADAFFIDALSPAPYAPKTERRVKSADKSLRIHLGIEDFSLLPINLELNADTPHMLIGGGPGSGKTSTLQLCLLMLASIPENREARLILVDFRRSSRLLRRLRNVWLYADNEDKLNEVITTLKDELRERMARLRAGMVQQNDDEPVSIPDPPIVLIVDDYEQFSILTRNPLNDLKEFLLQARDLHFHMIVSGSSNDLNKSEAFLQQIRAGRLGVVLGGDPQEQPLLGVRMSDLPPGRGYLVKRNKRYLTQIAHCDPQSLKQWLSYLKRAQMPDRAPKPASTALATAAAGPQTEDQQLLEQAQSLTDSIL